MLSTFLIEFYNKLSFFWNISGSWDPSETSFAVLNKETAPDVSSVYLTVAADLVMSQVAEPVRFVIETK